MKLYEKKDVDLRKNLVKEKLNTSNPLEMLKNKVSGRKKSILNMTNEPNELSADKNNANTSISNEIFAQKESINKNIDFAKKEDESDGFLARSLKKLDKSSNKNTVNMEPTYDSNHKKLPILGDLPINRQYQIAALIAIISFSTIILGGFLYGNSTIKENKSIQFSTEFSSDLQKVNTLFSEATLGKNQSYANLLQVVEKTKNDFKSLKDYNDSIKNNNDILSLQNKIQENLSQLDKNVAFLNNQADILVDSSSKVSEFNDNVNQITADVNTFINLYSQQNLNQNEIINVYSLKTNLQIINGSLSTILLSEKINPVSIDVLNKARQDLKTSLVALQLGNSSRNISPITQQNLIDSYQSIAKNWIKLSGKVDVITNKSAALIQIRDLAPQNEQLINVITKNVNDMVSLYKNNDLTGTQSSRIIIFLGLLLLIAAIVITFYIYSYEKDNRSLFEKIVNEKNKDFIRQLIAELIPLQQGDLTKQATVRDGVTGYIADSINATITSLASLVRKIQETSLIMKEKTGEVKLISLEMLEATEKQATSLNQTGSSVINIANAITEISIKTDKGAEEAQKSVQVSEKGAKQVQDSVKSMQEINNNMNQTVHLMQKVSNSSKQISEIVELLSDITESTSILALNATVQAAKAGDAGKGFKIVANSIQELADKASEETRRVGALISAVQTDIRAVEIAVQKTTQEVDNGVNLSELAGQSLNQMTNVSRELSHIVASISEEAKSHAESAKKVSESMQEILKTTEENKKSTEKTANSISEISEISNELGKSVQSFTI